MKYVLVTALILFSGLGFSNTIEKCLANSTENTAICAEKFIKPLTLTQCFSSAEKIKSDLSKENLKQFCFYQVSEFPNLNSCLISADTMTVMINHDDAVFECIRQFQNSLSATQCLELSKKMRYPEKNDYLRRKCNEL